MTEPAIEIEGLSKRYRGGGPLVPIPFRWGRRLERGRRMGNEHADYDLDAADDDVDDDVDDDDDFDDGDEFEERAAGARRETWALRDISVTIPAGARVALIGPDGGGKTTLVKILSGTAIPTLGRADNSRAHAEQRYRPPQRRAHRRLPGHFPPGGPQPCGRNRRLCGVGGPDRQQGPHVLDQ
jgi:ABC-type multidrug transport system ATPase subunit